MEQWLADVDGRAEPSSAGAADWFKKAVDTADRIEAAAYTPPWKLASTYALLAIAEALLTQRTQKPTRTTAITNAAHSDGELLTVADVAAMTTLLDTLRTVGLNVYSPLYDAILARVLIEAAQPKRARHRLDTGLQLAEDTGMHFYDAGLLRLRAHTHIDPDVRQADIGAALELAHREGATLFELRSALDDFELRGQPAYAELVDVVSRMPTTSAWPELSRAQVALDRLDPKTG